MVAPGQNRRFALPVGNGDPDPVFPTNRINAELESLSSSIGEPTFTEADAALGGDDDFDFLSGTDEAATKLDLAQAYIDMGDSDGARDILNEVVSEGSAEQKSEAREMLSRLA